MAPPTLADLGATARHIIGMAKRSQGVSAAEVETTCFLSREEAEKRLAGLAQLGHLQPTGRGRYVDAARIVAPTMVPPAPPAPAPPATARQAPALSPIGAPVRGEPARARGGPAAWRPARKQQLVAVPPPGVPEPVTVPPPAPMPGEAVIPPHVKVTRCPAPAYDARYQVDPSARPFGAGFAAAGIGRDPTTGKAWADAAQAEPPSPKP